MERFWNAFGMESFYPCQSRCLQGTTLGPAGLDGYSQGLGSESLPALCFVCTHFHFGAVLVFERLGTRTWAEESGKAGLPGPSLPPSAHCLWLEKGHAQKEEPFQVTKDTGTFGKGFWEVVTLYDEG